jgi:hypothetical protein
MQKLKEIFKAARSGTLPEGFDSWDLADKNGRTLAHAAGEWGHLPKSFGHWD